MAHGAPLVKICGTGSCFVAGTPVMTIEGLKAIETIQVGELVAARNELTQISAWQRVETVFITYDREVWNLSFVKGDGKIEVITATPNHPFALATGGGAGQPRTPLGAHCSARRKGWSRYSRD